MRMNLKHDEIRIATGLRASRLPAVPLRGMKAPVVLWRLVRSVGIAACILAVLPVDARSDSAAAEPIPVAVAEFDYLDTSGEPEDQQAKHAAQLQAFTEAIRADLERSGKYRIVPLVCEPAPCAVSKQSPEQLIAAARRAGAKLLVFGGIHKMSTLVQFAKVEILDLEADRLIFDRMLTFRGDSDDAWEHAERFVVRDILSEDLVY